LFMGGRVYDYLSGPERVAVFDPSHGRFILLDPKRKLKTEVSADEVREFVESLHELAARSSNPVTKFAADPEFTVDFSEEGELSLASAYINYKLQTVAAPTPTAAKQYHEFSDWYARFNTMANPGATPPFPRLAVNAELVKRGLIPTEVQLNIRSVAMRAEHHATWRLLERDHSRITETANQMATFEEVKFEVFQAPQVSKK
jgi:hypothetical protein